MDYQHLTDTELKQMADERARALETEHYGNVLALQAAQAMAAATTGDEKKQANAEIARLKSNLNLIEAAHADVVAESAKYSDDVSST